MINKKAFFKSLIIILLLIIIVFIGIQIRKTLAKYETTTTGERDIKVAFWILDNSYQTERMLIKDIFPRNNDPFEYAFTVSNFVGEDVAETDLEYELLITTTTNLPLSYQISLNGSTYNNVEEKLYTDVNGTVYRKLAIGSTDNPYPLSMNTIVAEVDRNGEPTGDYVKTKITHEYILQVTFPEQSYVNGSIVNNKLNIDYADLIEDIQISVTARQKIGE